MNKEIIEFLNSPTSTWEEFKMATFIIVVAVIFKTIFSWFIGTSGIKEELKGIKNELKKK